MVRAPYSLKPPCPFHRYLNRDRRRAFRFSHSLFKLQFSLQVSSSFSTVPSSQISAPRLSYPLSVFVTALRLSTRPRSDKRQAYSTRIQMMVSTTRGQSSARRRTLRSWQHWKPFVSPPVTLRKHTPEKSRKARQLCQKNKSVRTGLVNHLPLEVLEEIIIQIDARTILVRCQRVCKTWNKVISDSSAIQQRLGFQSRPKSKTIQINPFIRIMSRYFYSEHLKVGGLRYYRYRRDDGPAEDHSAIFGRPEASWRRMFRG